ncbi:RNAPII transcription regulator C-terminal-domain-containing protein [Crepidotus variabilis]|uniref:MMS19 nucleotide excision repair protein n=1 Tax=Crepidotus variabilis TaxID=179855 RepID=A0A9P6EMN7_9AGAR|nr:RNAPII transcription regulator C-terminal-domain-containing protein [Crepidotus variabilis]
MEATERLVQTWMASGRDEEINEIVSDISNDEATLIGVVKALGDYLTSEDAEILGKVELLSLVVARVPQNKLNLQAVRVLTAFFTGKLDDSATVKPALSGITTLASLTTFGAPEVQIVVEGIFNHVKMKALVQDVRFKVLSIIDSFMALHREVLKSMNKTFLDGYIALADGEKDPRNLMVAFAITRVILIEFDTSTHTESLFNICFCYFPITFRPPPNDKYGISAEDLKTSLRQCLNATPTFGTMAIPVFLEKLTAGSRATKKDTLQTLASCLPVYGSALGRAFARKLWNSLKLEIFQPVDVQAEEEALRTVQVLVKTIYAEEEAALESNDDIQGLARDACEECIQILKEPEKTQARAATKVLCAFLSTTPSVSRYTISQAVPHFIELFHNPDETSARAATLTLLSELVDSTKGYSSCKTGETAETAEPALSPFKDELVGVYTVGLQATSLRSPALAGLEALCSIYNLLTDEELGFVVHKVNDIIEGSPEEFEDASDELLALLTKISDYSPRHVSEQTLPLLFASLPDRPPGRDAHSEREKCWQTLSALRKLCVQQTLFESLVIRLTAKFDLLCIPSDTTDDLEPSQAYAHMLLKTLLQTLTSKVLAKHADVAKYIDTVVPRILNVFVASAFFEREETVFSDPRLISTAAGIITLVVQSLPTQRQQSYAVVLSNAILTGEVTAIAKGFQKFSSSQGLQIFGASSQRRQRDLLPLFSASVIALHKDVTLSLGEEGKFLDAVLKWIIEVADNDLQRNAALHMVAAIVNRRAESLSSFLSQLLESYWETEISNPSSTTDRRKLAIKTWTWISKALLVRKHPQAITFAEKLYDVFGDQDIGWTASKALGEIVSHDPVLTKANHANVKILYAQRYVDTVLPKIATFAKESIPPEQTSWLVALSAVIKSSPKTTYTQNFAMLIPLLLRGLDLPDADIRSNVIDTFLAAAEGETPESSIISEHSVTLANLMLKNSKVDEMPSMKVRISALRYLTVLPTIVRYDVLHPSKTVVLRELAKVLDDPIRAVRREAVDAR